MTSIPGPQIVSLENEGGLNGYCDGDDENEKSRSPNASLETPADMREDTQGDTQKENPRPISANLQVYNYAIGEAANVIDQLG